MRGLSGTDGVVCSVNSASLLSMMENLPGKCVAVFPGTRPRSTVTPHPGSVSALALGLRILLRIRLGRHTTTV